MQTIYQFFRLIRLSNLLVIVLTMSVFYGLLSNYHLDRQYILSNVGTAEELLNPSLLELIGWGDPKFVLLILSVVLIAGSGNIINDYFDLKADRVNKPNRLIIDKYIKRRWAIILNWVFNGIGFLIACILAYLLKNWWIVIISFLSINLLYFYSAIYKRKFLTGNIIVAFLTALVPLYVLLYGAFSNFKGNSPFGSNDEIFLADNLIAIMAYCGFAFMLNFVREVIKDMADVKGDLLLKSKTFPIRYGFKRTKYILAFCFATIVIPLVYYISTINVVAAIPKGLGMSRIYFVYLLIGVILSVLISFIILITKNRSKSYLLSSNLIKIAMLFGVISALFYA